MTRLFNRWFLLFFLLLGLSALACNLPFGSEPTPTPRPASDDDDDGDRNADNESEEVAPEDKVEETAEEDPPVTDEEETADSEPEEDSSLLDSLFQQSLNVSESVQSFDNLDSYEMMLDFSTTVDNTTQQVQGLILVTTNPPASQMNLTFSGLNAATEISEVAMTQIDGTSYTIVPDFGCLTSEEGDFLGDSFNGIADANEFLDDVGEAELVGEETINGIETLHYTFDETAVSNEELQFNWAQGNVYIAKEGSYVVRFTLEGEGNADLLGFGSDTNSDSDAKPEVGLIQISLDLNNINQPLDIKIPADCEETGTDSTEFPVLDDATEYSSFSGVITYKSATPFADIVIFLQEGLAVDGWVYEENESFILEDTTALLFFSKDGRALTATVTQETGAEDFLIVLFEE